MAQGGGRRALTKEHFGPLWGYVKDDKIINIDWNSGQLWVQYANKVPELVVNDKINEDTMLDFILTVGNHSGNNFNRTDNVVMAETDTLRIVGVHDSLSLSGITVCIRKSLPKLRFNTKMAIEQGYCSEEVMFMLINCVLAKKNFVFCGEPGKGKTEAAKFFSSFIPANQKVVTIEDVREWHYKEINPGKSCIELRATTPEDYEKALALVVRLNPSWMMVAETRGKEFRYLLEAWSNGISDMTTLHTKGVREIVDRGLNMLGSDVDIPSVTEQIYNNAGVGVYLEEINLSEGRTYHRIGEVGFFYRKDGVNGVAMVVEDGVFHPERLPDFIRSDIEKKIGSSIFECAVAYENTSPLVGDDVVEDEYEEDVQVEVEDVVDEEE